MKKITKFIGLLCVAVLLSVFICNTSAYAQDDKIIVTPDTLGSNDSIYVVRITKRVVEIQDGSFANLTHLREIRVDSDNQHYASYCGCLYNKDYTELLCIPQNTTSVQVKNTIKSYSPHALDGLSQERKDAVDRLLNNNNSIQSEQISNDHLSSNEENIENTEQNNQTEQPSVENHESNFSQYVYTDEKGRTAFKYTGSGDTAIYIPEGVEVVAGFSSDTFGFNYDITYVHLPSTIKKCLAADFYNTKDGGYDTHFYNYLYQCPNLQTVEGGGKLDYMCNGSSVVRRGGIVVWSNSTKVPYDAQAYIDYNNKNK